MVKILPFRKRRVSSDFYQALSQTEAEALFRDWIKEVADPPLGPIISAQIAYEQDACLTWKIARQLIVDGEFLEDCC